MTSRIRMLHVRGTQRLPGWDLLPLPALRWVALKTAPAVALGLLMLRGIILLKVVSRDHKRQVN